MLRSSLEYVFVGKEIQAVTLLQGFYLVIVKNLKTYVTECEILEIQ